MPFAKRLSRAGAFAWSPQVSPSNGLIVADFAQHFDPLAAPDKTRLDWYDADSFIESTAIIQPRKSVDVPFRCLGFRANSLTWCGNVTDAKPYGILMIGGEAGVINFIDPNALIQNSKLETISSRKDHQGHVLATDVSKDCKWAMSGGGTGQLLLWDLNNLSQPFSPGQPSFPDQVRCIRWNAQMESIFASLSSHRASIWDLRRNGAPVVDLAEIGGGCDWSQLSWSPADGMTLWTASQADALPVLYKWDLRYPTSPLKDHKVHAKGITCIDWNTNDTRFMLSASHDRQILLSDPETGEFHGKLGSEPEDWARAISWSPGNPDLVAIQYYQHPIQITNIQGFPAMNEQEEQGLQFLSVDLTSVPTWVSASPIGSKFGLGCRSAHYVRQWDQATNQWKYEVEIQKKDPDAQIQQIEAELQTAIDQQQLAGFCEDKAHAEAERDMQMLWLFLTAASSGQSRKEYLRLLGFSPTDDQQSNSVAAITNNMENLRTRGQSVVSAHSEGSDDVIADFGEDTHPLDLSAIDHTTWTTVGHLIAGEDQKVLSHLLERKDFTTALLLYHNDPALLRRITNQYFQESLSASSRLLGLLAAHKYDPLVNHAQSAPESWKYIIGCVLSRETDRSKMVNALRVLADRWRHEKSTPFVQAALCSIIAGDADGLLESLELKSAEQRIAIIRVLTRSIRVRCQNPKWEYLIGTHSGKLIDSGCLEAAYKLLSEADLTLSSLISLREALRKALGASAQQYANQQQNLGNLAALGRRQSVPYPGQQANHYGAQAVAPPPMAPPTMAPPPMAPPPSAGLAQPNYGNMYGAAPSNPYANGLPTPPITNQPYGYTAAVPPQQQYPPQGQSWSQTPAAPQYAPPAQDSQPLPPAAPGWNDPPPLPSKANQARPSSVMQVQWKPIEGAPPSAMGVPPISTIQPRPMYGQPQAYSPGNQGFAPQQQSPPQAQQPVYEEPKLTLAPDDQRLVDSIIQIADGVLAMSRVPAVVSRVEELKRRLNKDLTERLAYRKLGETTKNLLRHLGDSAARGDFHSAQQIAHQMVTTGQDFVEVSAFLPPLKSLLSQAASSFQQNYR